ncbi:unnamed protein product [Effrenium voratum]|nr:unnamed protein product [Effrenium voratum]
MGKRCCRTFASGFAAEQLPLAVTAVANEGSQGGMLYFKGTAPKLAEQGFAFRLSGGTGMELAQGAAKFTAMAYLKLHPSTDDSAGKDQPVLRRDGGYQGAALWELVATPLKQFKLRATKDTGPAVATCTCPSVLEDVWTHVMVRHVAGALQLLLGGQLCCEAKESTWLDAALGKSSTTWLAKGITADLHMVQLWDEAISDADATSLVSRYTQAVASWLPQQQLTCVEDLLGSFPSSSLASCKLACEQHGACRSVLFEASKDGANGTCSLRDRWVCPHNQDCRCRCGPSSTTLAANYDPGCRGAFDWRFTVDTTDNAVAFTELALYGNQKALQGRVLDEESKEVTGCALADGSGAGTGCEMHAAALGGLWEYRFAACSAPSSLVVAAQAGSFSLNVSYSTPTGDWKLCAQTFGAKGSLSTSLGCVPAAKPWWQH